MATVTPGYTWTSGEVVTPAKMNSAATPTVVVADGEVTAAKLAATLDLTGKTVTLPTSTTATIADASVTAPKLSGAQTGAAPVFAARAWVNFNATTGDTIGGEFRCTIRASGNVSKVVRTATGRFTIHFTVALPSSSYCTLGSIQVGGTTDANAYNDFFVLSQSTASANIGTSGGWNVNGAANSPVVCVAFFA